MTKPTDKERLLALALHGVLIAAGVLHPDSTPTGPELITAAEDFISKKSAVVEKESYEPAIGTKKLSGFTKNNDGVHFLSGINPEYTMCGEPVIDQDPGEDGFEMRRADTDIVSCPQCIREIENCRGVRIRKNAPK